MVIDFSRLNSSSSLTGSTRTSVAKETAEAGKSAPLNTPAEQASTVKSGESVHLSNEAQQLQLQSRQQPCSQQTAQLRSPALGYGPRQAFGRLKPKASHARH
jgi:hypothetical protein